MKPWVGLLLVMQWCVWATWAAADVPASAPESAQAIAQWLQQLHQAARKRAYTGTVVVTQEGGAQVSTAKLWHVCDGTDQMERIESLTGAPRSTWRRNSEVVTVWPDAGLARTEQRGGLLPLYPLTAGAGNAGLGHYKLVPAGLDRVAGHPAERFDFQPKDGLRYLKRIWRERDTGLAVKLQTLDGHGRVLEQVVFTDLQLRAPVDMAELKRQMSDLRGYRVESVQRTPTDPQLEGWRLRGEVQGFGPVGCHRASAAGPGRVQWVFSDGLASVSLFIEPFDAQRHAPQKPGAGTRIGATSVWTWRIGDWWVTGVGEVPVATLKMFARQLERIS